MACPVCGDPGAKVMEYCHYDPETGPDAGWAVHCQKCGVMYPEEIDAVLEAK
jgi:uncharacterized Zn finger protein